MNRRSFFSTAAASGLLITSGLRRGLAASGDLTSSPAVSTATGKVMGLFDGRVHIFKGIPYAASPEGNGRFLPPSLHAPWTGVRQAVEFGPRCFQPVRPMIPEMSDALTGHGPMSENCLTLNVWTSGLNRNARKPVMVWFHGGGMRSGWSGSILYDGTELAAKHDVVLVSVNHRLNLFGFLYLAETGVSQYAHASNAGALDLVAALQWVRENIASFGGDPANVTIFGQSGGGGKVSTVQAMPAAQGLFHRMIIQSSGAGAPPLRDAGLSGTPKDESVQWAEIYLNRLGLKPKQAEQLAKIPAEKLIAAATTGAATRFPFATNGDISSWFVPVVDGKTLPSNPFDPAAPEISAHIPLMVGSVETETIPYGAPNDAYWATDEIDAGGLRQHVKRTLKADDATADRIIGLYREGRPTASNMDLAMTVAGDADPARQATLAIAERKAIQNRAAVFLYYFKWYSPLRQGKVRCMHGMELPFVFDHVDAAQWMTGEGHERAALADKVSRAWAAFARSGNPNHKGLEAWKAFDPGRRPTMVFDNVCQAVDDPHGKERLAIKAALDARPAPRA